MDISRHVTDRFSSALDRRDQGPNEAIAQQIVEESNAQFLDKSSPNLAKQILK